MKRDFVRSTFVLDVRSENRRAGDPIDDFLFPLAQAGIVTPEHAQVSIHAVGGLVPLENATPASFDRRFRVYIENLPVRGGHTVTSFLGDSRLAVAHGDYRMDLSVYATIKADMQPTLQLVSGAMLPDLRVYLLDENGQRFAPGSDWTLQLQIDADQARYANLFE